MGLSRYCDFHRMEWVARSAGLGLASLKNLSGLWATDAVPGCLVPGPGVTRAEGNGQEWALGGQLAC